MKEVDDIVEDRFGNKWRVESVNRNEETGEISYRLVSINRSRIVNVNRRSFKEDFRYVCKR